jgi:hypothetical protein
MLMGTNKERECQERRERTPEAQSLIRERNKDPECQWISQSSREAEYPWL